MIFKNKFKVGNWVMINALLKKKKKKKMGTREKRKPHFFFLNSYQILNGTKKEIIF
jgi:hypothetical protein